MKFFLCLFFIACSVVNVIAKSFDINLSSQSLNLGDTLAISVSTDRPISSYKIVFMGRKFRLFSQETDKGYSYTAFIGASRYAKSGKKILIMSLTTDDNASFYEHYAVELDHPKQPVGKVNLTKKARHISEDYRARRQEIQLLAKAFSVVTNERYFDGPFQLPSQGKVSSSFGKMRRYNNGGFSSHAGVDFADQIGSPVLAPQKGRVILSQALKIHGNTVLIDHGQGVLSIYCHLDKLDIKQGDFVTTGTKIGELGSTGIVSGPHLHWGFSVQNVRVDPLFWVEAESHYYSFLD